MSEGFINSYEDLTFHVIKSLEKRSGVCNIKHAERPPVNKSAIITWEQKYTCTLPEDLKQFYLTTNGFLLEFSSKSNEGAIPVGKMEINPIEKLLRIGLQTTGSNEEQAMINEFDFTLIDKDACENKPKFDSHSRAFELDSCGGCGRACYVFKNTKPGLPAGEGSVWFLDRSLQWHFLADTFLEYFRLLIVHLGLPQWQYLFTDIGLSQQAMQWFNLYCPTKLSSYVDNEEFTNISVDNDKLQNRFDVNKVFKGKQDKKQVKQQVQSGDLTKKRSVSSAKNVSSQSQHSRPAGK